MANQFRSGQAFRDELNKRIGNFFRGLANGFSEGPENTYKQLKEELATRVLDELLDGVHVANGMQAAEAIREALARTLFRSVCFSEVLLYVCLHSTNNTCLSLNEKSVTSNPCSTAAGFVHP